MKADAFGTWDEQRRHRIGWQPGVGAVTCRSCVHFRADGTRKRCVLFGFATRAFAVCARWEPLP